MIFYESSYNKSSLILILQFQCVLQAYESRIMSLSVVKSSCCSGSVALLPFFEEHVCNLYLKRNNSSTLTSPWSWEKHPFYMLPCISLLCFGINISDYICIKLFINTFTWNVQANFSTHSYMQYKQWITGHDRNTWYDREAIRQMSPRHTECTKLYCIHKSRHKTVLLIAKRSKTMTMHLQCHNNYNKSKAG